MKKNNYGIESASGVIIDVNYYEIKEPKGLVHILHGMQEHKERYDDFARFLADNGYCVLTHDHLGHGKSVSREHGLGDMISLENVLDDIDRVRKSANLQSPYICFGHSMGSFLARIYSSVKEVDELIACGTGINNNALINIMKFILFFNRSGVPLKGFQRLLMGNLSRGFENPSDWLSLNEENQKRYEDDELCGKPFTKEGYAVLLNIIRRLNDKDVYENCTAKKILLVSGEKDPVGGFGTGVRRVEDRYRSCGKQIETILYDNMSHEILNEKDNLAVYNDILKFIKEAEA